MGVGAVEVEVGRWRWQWGSEVDGGGGSGKLRGSLFRTKADNEMVSMHFWKDKSHVITI